MTLIDELKEDLEEAVRERDEDLRDAIRLILNALQMAEKELQRPLTQDEELQVLQRERKRRVEAAEAYRAAGREEQAEDEEYELEVLEDYMPDPLSDDFTIDVLRRILEAEGRKQIKGVMRMQSIIAGIGNAYSDEILHAARMSPFKPASSLEADDLQTLYDAIRGTLGDAVARSSGLAAAELKGEKKSNLAVHGRTGQACPVCGDLVREVSFADSSLQYCATCQTGGKPLADRRMSRLLK